MPQDEPGDDSDAADHPFLFYFWHRWGLSANWRIFPFHHHDPCPSIIIVRADLLDRIVDIPFSVQTTHWLSCGRGLVLCFAFRSAIPNSIFN